jgi:hypothetical protein
VSLKSETQSFQKVIKRRRHHHGSWSWFWRGNLLCLSISGLQQVPVLSRYQQ